VYVTVTAENHAGLKTIFQTMSPIIIDHTPPVIGNLTVYIDDTEENETGVVVKGKALFASWSVSDRESNIQYCSCAVGMLLCVRVL